MQADQDMWAPLSLICVLLEENRVFPIDVPAAKKIGELKDLIKAKLSVGCAADQFTLYRVTGDLEETPPAGCNSESTSGFQYKGAPMLPAKLGEVVLPHATMMLASRQVGSYFPIGSDSERSFTSGIDIMIESPTGAPMSDVDVFLAKLNDALQHLVATRLDWMKESMGEIDNCMQDIRGYIKWTHERMTRAEAQLVSMDALMTAIEPKVARMEASVAGIVSSLQRA